MFEGFKLDYVDVGDATLRMRMGGEGPPVLLLHGHPRTHTTWHLVAPILARNYTVICPDLRGFGQSTKPPDLPDHAGSSKRAKGNDCLQLMTSSGSSVSPSSDMTEAPTLLSAWPWITRTR